MTSLTLAVLLQVSLAGGEKAAGLQLKAKAFGDPTAFALWELARALNPDMQIRVIHAGTGTLWTDLEKAGAGDLGGAVILQDKSAP